MFTKFKISALIIAIAAVVFTSCKKDDNTPTPVEKEKDKKEEPKKPNEEPNHGYEDADPSKKGTLDVAFENFMHNEDFKTLTEYTTSSGEKYQVEQLKYFISNIKLEKEDGSFFVYPYDECYFLVRQDDSDPTSKDSRTIHLKNIPEGNYKSITYNVGVDSLKSTQPVEKRTGHLAMGYPHKQYWSWKKGYVFYILNGFYTNKAGENDGVNIHIGLYGGDEILRTDNNNRWVTVPFGKTKAYVREKAEPMVHIKHHVDKLLDGKHDLPIKQYNQEHGTRKGKLFADNIQGSFSLIDVHDHAHH